MSKLVQISPSQLKTKKRCFRKWGFQKIDGLEDPPGAGAILGTAAHALTAEHYSGRPFAHMGDDQLVEIHSEAPKARRLANALISYYGDVPDPIVEQHLVVERSDYQLHGYADLVYRALRVNVCDHKTSKNPERYAMADPDLEERTPPAMRSAILLNDEQAIVYSAAAMERFGVDEVDLHWVYVATQGRARTLPVTATLTRAHVMERLEGDIHVHAMDIVRARREVKSAIDLPYNPEACADFGGCPFVELCPRSLEDKLVGLFDDEEGNDMSLRDLVEKRRKLAPPAGENGATNKPKEQAANTPKVNAPESPQDPETQRDMSRAGATRIVAETVAQGGTPEDGKVAEDRDQIARKSPKAAEILRLLSEGQELFSSRQDKADADRPFAHGRTLNSLRKDGLLEYEEEDVSTRRVWLTPAGIEKMGIRDKEAVNDRGTYYENGRDAGVADAIGTLLRTGNRDFAWTLATALADRLSKP